MMTVIIKTWSTPDSDDSDFENLVNPNNDDSDYQNLVNPR